MKCHGATYHEPFAQSLIALYPHRDAHRWYSRRRSGCPPRDTACVRPQYILSRLDAL